MFVLDIACKTRLTALSLLSSIPLRNSSARSLRTVSSDAAALESPLRLSNTASETDGPAILRAQEPARRIGPRNLPRVFAVAGGVPALTHVESAPTRLAKLSPLECAHT